jgi:hypothetical protein
MSSDSIGVMDSELTACGANCSFSTSTIGEALSNLGDRLEAFRAAVDFELFRAELNVALGYSDGSEGGRPLLDPVMMFKILVIQATKNVSGERAEFLINDRLSVRAAVA